MAVEVDGGHVQWRRAYDRSWIRKGLQKKQYCANRRMGSIESRLQHGFERGIHPSCKEDDFKKDIAQEE